MIGGRVVLLIAVLALASCKESSGRQWLGGAFEPAKASVNRRPNGTAAEALDSNNTDAAILVWDASQCGDDDYQNERLERHPKLMGSSVDQLVRAYGTPSNLEEFKVGEPVGVFYGELGRTEGAAARPLAGKSAKVLTWTKSDCNFSVFFVQRDRAFEAVNAFEWGIDADF